MNIEQKVNAIMRYIVAESYEEKNLAISEIKNITENPAETEKIANIEEVIDSILTEIGMPCHFIGYNYIVYAIKISIENTNGYFEYEKKAITYLLESSIFSLTWDIGHSNGSGNVDEEFILVNQNRLAHFHIHDSLGKKDHLTLGTGEIDLKKRLHLAEELGCTCVVETKTISSLKESIQWLRQEK